VRYARVPARQSASSTATGSSSPTTSSTSEGAP
jgi:hypothetical protein